MIYRETSSTKRQRETWIDVLKGIGIILVVIGHVSLGNTLNSWIYTFHMPLFFSVSGYLWGGANEKISFKEFFFKRIKSILWPFILFRVLLIIYWIAVESHFRSLDLGPIWFLIVLFIDEIVGFLLLYKNRKTNVLFNCLLIVAFAVMWIELKQFLPETMICIWSLRCLNGLMWYLVGHLVGLLIIKANINTKCGVNIPKISVCYRYVALMVLLTISIWISIINPGSSMWSNEYGNNYFLYLIGGVVGSEFMMLFCRWLIKTNKFLEMLGKNTIVILAIHEPLKRVVLKIIEIILNRLGIAISADVLQTHIVSSLIVVTAIMFLSVMMIYIIKFIKGKMPYTIRRNFLDFVK